VGGTWTYSFGGSRYSAAREFFPLASEAGLAPRIISRTGDVLVVARGTPLPEWLESADPVAIRALRERVLQMIIRLHTLGVCHRDLHWANIVIIDGEPLAIDFEHALRTDASWECYDLYGPSDLIPLLADHAKFQQVLGTQGIWWGAQRDERWGSAYTPLGYVLGPL
jgi:hypothetical protein